MSPKAIEMAINNGKELKLIVEFFAKDIINIDGEGNIDLVTDSSLLHCLVSKEDRSAFYNVVKKSLSKIKRFVNLFC